tara:strand:- start:889 stop:1317 length:429 start_codon:yes stop_codon:yes gene_type:complete
MIERLVKQLRLHEGSRQFAYEDHLGYVTVGVGRCLDEKVGLGLSEAEIDFLLKNDIERCTAELQQRFDWFDGLDEVRKVALVDMNFNMGITRLSKFKNMLSALEEARYDDAATEALDSRWAKQVGQRSINVSEMLRTGEYFQ